MCAVVSQSVVRFGDYELDLKNRELRRQGLWISLQPQAFRILVLLASRPKRLVTRQEIIDEIWPSERFGDLDSRLNFEVSKLREALRDEAERPRYIETVRRNGYRFIAAVDCIQLLDSEVALKQDQPSAVGTAIQETKLLRPQTFPDLEAAVVESSRPPAHLHLLLAGAVIGAVAVLLARATMSHLYSTASVSQQRTADPNPKEISFVPVITSVTPIFAERTQQVIIEGRGFGHYYTPLRGLDTPFLAIADDTGHWSAGRIIPENADEVTLLISTWTDTQIVIDGFAGEYGRHNWMLKSGDIIKIRVWNPQTGAGPAEYFLTVGMIDVKNNPHGV